MFSSLLTFAGSVELGRPVRHVAVSRDRRVTYSPDLRMQVLDAASRGIPIEEIVTAFRVSTPTFVRSFVARTQTGIPALARILVPCRGGEWVPRRVISANLSVDHRGADGADGARFLRSLQEALSD